MYHSHPPRSTEHSPSTSHLRSPTTAFPPGSHPPPSSYMPPAAHHQQQHQHQHHHHYHPQSPTSYVPPQSSMNGVPVPPPPPPPRDRGPSTFFDPTSEHRQRRPSWADANAPVSPTRPHRYNYDHQYRHDPRPYDREYPPSTQPSHSHASPRAYGGGHSESHQRSPADQRPHSNHEMTARPPPPAAATPTATRPPSVPTSRVADPMSFSNILSSSDDPPPAPAPRQSPHMGRKPSITMPMSPPPAPAPRVIRDEDRIVPPPPPVPKAVKDELPSPTDKQPLPNGTSNYKAPAATQPITVHSNKMPPVSPQSHMREAEPALPVIPAAKPKTPVSDTELPRPKSERASKLKPTINEKDVLAALAKIDSMDHSDVDEKTFAKELKDYRERRGKRTREIDIAEKGRRKRRRVALFTQLNEKYGRHAMILKEKYINTHEQEILDQVYSQEQAIEKERKKAAQQTKRRETLKKKAEKQAEYLNEAVKVAEDSEKKEQLLKQLQKARKKVSNQTKLLNGETPSKDIREITPLAPNLEGGIMSSFQMGDEAQEPSKKKQRTGGRLKKSKEQKQMEKDTAAAGHAALERGEELVSIAPKPETSAKASKRDAKAADDSEAAEQVRTTSKQYENMYEQIWRDIARKDVPKVYRLKENSLATKQSNLRKTAQLASKEARRWQLKTNKSNKDTQARAKRVMREMLGFWKRNEREERDQRKMAEKQELENAKKAEADREANRQKRKLNFLISQTELYSHFIGKKIKTDEAERSTTDATPTDEIIQDSNKRSEDLPEDGSQLGPRVTNFEELDFDNEDESVLYEAAKANAYNALKETQDRARSFNTDGELQAQFDDGEMNFQNPTSLQSMDIPQPRMLSCQLKEYQLKGLNWLVNLYEQGINGILADEMGLGKTVQSISVMAYLAETHNIWGPFLVIAPASTLHNWQQEIVRFVPGIKVLPYWGSAKDRKVLRKFWDRKHITYTRDSPFHVLVTSYQLVVHDSQYFQKVKWQYMILDEAQAIKSSQSTRWKNLLGFHCRNRLLLTGTPIQNNMQELWALLHFIMPSLFDSHDEFSDWFSKDIESHAQSNTKLNEDQLKRLHMILKPFMLRRVKKNVQKELGDKVEKDVFCDLTYRQRAYYLNLRNKISIMELIEKAAIGDDQDTATLMNLVMQFRKVCNHPDLFERAETTSPMSFGYFAETASFLREGSNVDLRYSVRSHIELAVPRIVARESGRLDLPGPQNDMAGWRNRFLHHDASIWNVENILSNSKGTGAFSWLPFVKTSAGEVAATAKKGVFERGLVEKAKLKHFPELDPEDFSVADQENAPSALFNIAKYRPTAPRIADPGEGPMHDLLNVSASAFVGKGLNAIEPCYRPAVSAPPIEVYAACQGVNFERQQTYFNVPFRKALYPINEKTDQALLEAKVDPIKFPTTNLLPAPISEKARYTQIRVPSMRRFVTDSGKLAKLDQLLAELKEGGHRVLLYFQMTRMIDLMEEYLTYRNYKYCRLDGSTKLEDRRDTVADFQNRGDIFVFLLSTRAGGLGINLTAADTVIFYDSDWNPTIDSQAMDRAHRLGQTKQVTVYRMITRGTIEERIRKRALQKEEVQRVVISGGAGAHVDFNTRSRENRTKDIAMWLADEDQVEEIEKREAEIAEKEAKEPQGKKKKAAGGQKKKLDVTLDDMYHEGEGHFDDSNKPSGAATPVEAPTKGKRKGMSKKAKSVKEKLAIIDGMA